MKKTRITVTEAARSFADCVNRVHYQRTSFVLLKNGKAMAYLVPDEEKVCLGRDAAEALAKAQLSPEEAKAWQLDLKTARKFLKPPSNKWR
jgi:ethanolamine utilization microcompartment shell protein EutL